ncbi:MAG: YebC/PmpR family DNA-binding transcriptional regulator [Acidimicrobiia bacterium]|nr:YebC/PmpR family DNA-binding transcriptional regulator [Acidimicrobiia bacterium]NNL28007.1 YebC/PmpR family DNA-binding transcriptional regulator [Acidimicrobiia bacterium]
MSGHSKWSTIKHKKGAKDAKRGKLFAKLVKIIEVAAREGGGDPDSNASLANAIQKAKDSSVPKDNIERAIARGTGEVEGVNYEEMWYEGYAPGGVAVFVHALTDNRNRASSDIRAAFSKNGGNLGEPGSVGYLFSQMGQIICNGDEEAVMLAALDAGAEDIRPSDDGWEVITQATDLPAVRAALEAAGISIANAEVTQLPSVEVTLDKSTASQVLRILDALDDLDDVQDVYANFDIPEDIMEELGADA